MAGEIPQPSHPSDPVEMRRINFQTPGMASHPPIPITELADHIERLKAQDNLRFSQEYEVCKITSNIGMRYYTFLLLPFYSNNI